MFNKSIFAFLFNKVDHFAKLANERLGSKGKVSVFGSSQLGKDKQGMQKVKLGTVNMWLPSSVMASIHDEFGVFEVGMSRVGEIKNLSKLINLIKSKLKSKFVSSEDILITRERHRQNLTSCVSHLERFNKNTSCRF